MIKKLNTCCLLLAFAFFAKAQCPDGQSEVTILITPDGFPNEISWTLIDNANQGVLASGGPAGQVVCVPTSQCVKFTIEDSFGDGIFLPGFCRVLLDGVEIFDTHGQAYFEQSVVMNCPPGTICTSPQTVTEGVHTAPNPDFWYTFIPQVNGNYTVSTCGLANTCNTKLYAYDHCPPSQTEGPLGVIAYNDDYCDGLAEFTVALVAFQPVFLRIGDSDADDCNGQSIEWSLTYSGPISGCTDTLACNFNPLAEVPDLTECEYPPAGQTCDGPDLAPGYETLLNSLQINNHHQAQSCEVAEGCILGTGERQLLYYGVTIWNYGNQPYYPGTPTNNPDAYEWAECHGHYHYIGFAESYLYDENHEQVDFARKTSYAIVNTNCLPGVTPNGPALAPGCGDTYPAGYACQWVDITDIAPGNYTLLLRVNGPELPDYLGRIETNFDNNAVQVCLYIGQHANGDKYFQVQAECEPFLDCEGVPLGNSVADCSGTCNGSRIRGDLNLDEQRTEADVTVYMDQIMEENLDPVVCNQLTNDTTFTVLDVARLNGCTRFQEGEHNHIGGGAGTHGHCNFPFHVINQQESVVIGLNNMNANYFDIHVSNNLTYLLGFDLQIEGVAIDSVVNVAGNFNPTIAFNASGHIMALAMDEFPLNKYFDGQVLRVYFSELLTNTICIAAIYDAVNSDAERISHEIGDCLFVTDVPELAIPVSFNIAPNPTTGAINVTIEGGLLGDARYYVTDLTGKVVASGIRQANRTDFALDLSGQTAGIYFLSVENEHFVKTERFVIQR
ncbi:MAG: T9SS type A sorting domain-containing protein [Saprospiraceae bacterium]|nr:T9SS type A sorting domain-containing protein [Saprospiraceae bacterium]